MQRLLSAAQVQKLSGNRLYATNHPQAAVDAYHLALASTPIYLTQETSILHSNLAACFLKLGKWQKALEHAQKAVCGRPGWARPLIRRARAREGIAGWKELESAVEEYEGLLSGEVESVKLDPELTASERKEVTELLEGAKIKLERARQEGVGEVMKGLKELGNGLLKPFGMSTDNFIKDAKTGGYSVQMNRGGGGGGAS